MFSLTPFSSSQGSATQHDLRQAIHGRWPLQTHVPADGLLARWHGGFSGHRPWPSAGLGPDVFLLVFGPEILWMMWLGRDLIKIKKHVSKFRIPRGSQTNRIRAPYWALPTCSPGNDGFLAPASIGAQPGSWVRQVGEAAVQSGQ